MKQIALIVIAIAVLSSCKSQTMNGTSGWENLISVSAWHTWGKTEVSKAWTIKDQILHFNPAVSDKSQRGDLVTNKEYENFHLKYDWKIAKNGNSGVLFNVKDDAVKYQYPWLTGPEMQVLDNNGHPDAKKFKHRAGDLYDLIASKKETVKLAGEWNSAEIILNKGELKFYLNGENIVSTSMWNDNWNKIIAASKFKSMPDFGTFRSGKIVLQDHGDEVWFKNILIKKL